MLAPATRLSVPDFLGVFGDRAVAGKSARCRDVQNGFSRPVLLVPVQVPEARVGVAVAREVREMQVVVPAEQAVQQWSEHARLVPAEMIAGDQVERLARFGIVFVVPPRV